MFKFWTLAYVRHLEAEIEYLREQYERERTRAEAAIDTLLNVRIQVAPVSLPPRDAQQADKLIEQMMRDPEFARVGDADTP